MYEGQNLVELTGVTPCRFAINVVSHIYGESLRKFVLNDKFVQPYNSRREPISKSNYRILQSIQNLSYFFPFLKLSF